MSNADPNAKAFLAKKVNPILEKLVVELVMKRPDNVTQFMVNWLQDKGANIEKSLGAEGKVGYEADSDEDSEDEATEDLMDIKQLQQMKAAKEMRTSVSSEVYGQFNQKKSFQPKVINKSQEQKNRIKNRLQQAFMFSALDENEQKIVVDSMQEVNYKAGDKVISQGEDGEVLYVVDSGELDCFKSKENGGDVHLKVYREGEAFGELALLYNAPRAATIKAKTNVTLFGLDRETFNYIVKDAASRKRQKYENFLSKVDILENMSPYERLQVADAIKTKKYSPGDFIVKEGEVGETFFILETGTAKATKQMQVGKEPETVYNYKPGEYFGEIALLKNPLRAANVIAVSECQVVYLDRKSFARLLGPLEDILKRNFAKYEKYMG